MNRPLPSREAIALEGKAFPFGQRVYHLSVEADIWDVKADRAFNPVEVIVESRIFVDKQGSGHAAQIQRIAQIHLKVTLDKLDCPPIS